ncbi:MAG TPA: hypothetical protein VF609_01960 [Flavisolibacter sp.]|jgi:hypothetical protein
MENLPLYIITCAGATTFLTVFFFYKAAAGSKILLLICMAWLGIQAAISLTGFYTVTHVMPPRFILTILPPFIAIAACFFTKSGRSFLDRLNVKWLSLLHVVRLPVEMLLLWLAIHTYVPQLMTFEGRNPDILSGITAPFIFYFGYVRKNINRKLLITWNLVCLALLCNIVINAILAAPSPFQQFAFDQPNIAVLYFPFVWLPCFIVPLVLFSHLVSIRQLISQKHMTRTSSDRSGAATVYAASH